MLLFLSALWREGRSQPIRPIHHQIILMTHFPSQFPPFPTSLNTPGLHNHGIRKINVFLRVCADKLDYQGTKNRKTSHSSVLSLGWTPKRVDASTSAGQASPCDSVVSSPITIMSLDNYFKIICVIQDGDCLLRERGPTCVSPALNASITAWEWNLTRWLCCWTRLWKENLTWSRESSMK